MYRITSPLTTFVGGILGVACALFIVAVTFAQVMPFSLNTPTTNPSISKLWPESGGRGQYITVEGANFGATQGRTVFIRRGVEIAADIPTQGGCEGQTWHDKYAVIKVPTNLELGQYTVKLYRTDNQVTREVSFTVTSAPSSPGICAITPDNGPAGIAVKVYGEKFGNNAGRIIVEKADATVQAGGWAAEYIEAVSPISIPAAAKLRVIDANNNLSNPIPFTVGRCTQAMCGASSSCCGDGSCRATGMCVDKATSCTYRWSFTTGDLKKVGETCSTNEQCLSRACGADKKCTQGSAKENTACTWDQECSQGLMCSQSVCKSRLRPVGQSCNTKEECSSNICSKSRCAQGTRPTGSQCATSAQCTSNNCINAQCVPTPKKVAVLDI
ncbi:MAG: hypothetical protein AAB870_01710, partial [Patescibacteria group bacterium]